VFGLLLALVYVCFISLGLPDSLLGSAWPVLHVELGVPLSYAGVISAVISAGTIVSSFFSEWLTKKLGAGLLTAVSVAATAVALFGFSVSRSFAMLLLWSVPYGLGAGAVDATLNNYVALHFKAQHMSWLHCSWGVGASISPYIMTYALARLNSWSRGYLIVSCIQICLSVVIFCSLRVWKQEGLEPKNRNDGRVVGLREIFGIRGAFACMLMFFFYCALEVSASLWVSSYLTQYRSFTPEAAAGFAGLFYLGVTLGRAINGFLAMRLSDRFLIRMGLGIVTVGLLLVLVPQPTVLCLAGFLLVGLGCAPVYPCIIHMTPSVFGAERSQAIIGVMMAFAYTGWCVMPPLIGFLTQWTDIALLPLYLLSLLLMTAWLHERVLRRTKKGDTV